MSQTEIPDPRRDKSAPSTIPAHALTSIADVALVFDVSLNWTESRELRQLRDENARPKREVAFVSSVET